MRVKLLALFVGTLLAKHASMGDPVIVLGSKKFTESQVLTELAKRNLEDAGFKVEHRQGMGGTIILWEALRQGSIAAYPDYTGTLQEEILKRPWAPTMGQLRGELAEYGVGVTDELGFNNTYALVMTRARARQLGIQRISELSMHPELRLGFTHEFLGRHDGWKPLQKQYSLAISDIRGIDHTLGYLALLNGEIDVKDAYTTDAKIAENDLVVLADDLKFFPQYRAVFLYRLDTPNRVIQVLRRLEGTLDEARMVRLNEIAEQTKEYSPAADWYFNQLGRAGRLAAPESLGHRLVRWTLRHLILVGMSLGTAIAVGVPLGIYTSGEGFISEMILGITGLIQTVPALALLALLVPIPFLGIRPITAVVALFLYGLLPIVRNTATGLRGISPQIRDAACVLSLKPRTRLLKIFLPLASPSILAGIKTSAIITIGSATLAALIGAGGLGEPIISGLNLNDTATILEGAIPAALMAIAAQGLFSIMDLVGGECSYWACMPSKALLRPGAALEEARSVSGAREAITGELDVSNVFMRRDNFTTNWNDAGQVNWLRQAKVDLLRGHGRLSGERRVVVTSKEGAQTGLVARHAIVVCTGSEAAIPPVPGLAEARPWTNHEAVSARTVPRRLAILGGGAVACEMATAWRQLGTSEVTIIERGPRLLPKCEPFAGELLRDSFERRGVSVLTETTVWLVERQPGGMARLSLSDGKALVADQILVAAGRLPRTRDIGLETVGLKPGGWLDVDSSMRVKELTGGWLHAAGDVNHQALLTHMGKYQARVCGDAIAARAKGKPEASAPGPWTRYSATADDCAVPQVIFSDPEIAAVGLTEAAALARGMNIRSVDCDIGEVAGAELYADGYKGHARMVVDQTRGVLVGMTLAGPSVGELIHAATIAIVGEVPIERLWHAVPSYPTISEIWLRLFETLGL